MEDHRPLTAQEQLQSVLARCPELAAMIREQTDLPDSELQRIDTALLEEGRHPTQLSNKECWEMMASFLEAINMGHFPEEARPIVQDLLDGFTALVEVEEGRS